MTDTMKEGEIGHYTNSCFFHEQYCNDCGTCCGAAFLPKLLDGPIEFICRREGCGNKWSYAATAKRKKQIQFLMVIKDQLVGHWKECEELLKILKDAEPKRQS